MKRILFILIISGFIIECQSQSLERQMNTVYKDVLTRYVNMCKSPFKTKSLDVLKLQADSIICYSDSLETDPISNLRFTYSDAKISVELLDPENSSGNWVKYSKFDFYLNNNLPTLTYETVNEECGTYNGYTYYHSSSIGDSLSISYIWDTLTASWFEESKTQHFISESGIDTLALTYIWDTTNKKWELNTIARQFVKTGDNDTIRFLLLFPDEQDTIKDYTYVYHYNENNQFALIEEYGRYNITVDSLIYNSAGNLIFENERYSSGDNYAFENRYDEEGRRKVSFTWDKHSNQSEYVFNGTILFYYPPNLNSINKEIECNDNIIFPNPSGNNIFISEYQGKVIVSDLSGKKLLEKDLSYNEPLYIGKLMNGSYLLSLENGLTRLIIKK